MPNYIIWEGGRKVNIKQEKIVEWNHKSKIDVIKEEEKSKKEDVIKERTGRRLWFPI